MVVDASAIIAMMLGEPEADALADRLEAATPRLTHPLSVYEATAALAHIKQQPMLACYEAVAEFLSTAGLEIVAIHKPESIAAIEAFARYGKGQGHPAQLNMGDCFSYACARVRGTDLLYKGDDFARTDLE